MRLNELKSLEPEMRLFTDVRYRYKVPNYDECFSDNDIGSVKEFLNWQDRKGKCKLTDREKEFIELYYYDMHTYDEISVIMDVSVTRITQLKHSVLRKIGIDAGRYIEFGQYVEQLEAQLNEYKKE